MEFASKDFKIDEKDISDSIDNMKQSLALLEGKSITTDEVFEDILKGVIEISVEMAEQLLVRERVIKDFCEFENLDSQGMIDAKANSMKEE